MYKFAAPGEAVHFNGCDSDFDTIFAILTEEQYNAGYDTYDSSTYTARNDDSWHVCGDYEYSSYLNLPYDSSYTGDYYLVIIPFGGGSLGYNSTLTFTYSCSQGITTTTPSPTYTPYPTSSPIK